MGMDAVAEVIDDAASPADAIEWFVANGAAEGPGLWYLRRWEVWVGRPGNRADYANVFEMERALRMLPPPRRESRQVLVQDAMSDVS